MGRKNWDYTRNQSIDEQDIKDYVSELSRLAQKAEQQGRTVEAEAYHEQINREIDDWKNGRYDR